MKNRIIFLLVFLGTFMAGQVIASQMPRVMSLYSQSGNDTITVEHLLIKGKKADYLPFGQTANEKVNLWTTKKSNSKADNFLEIQSASIRNHGYSLMGVDAGGRVMLYPGGQEDSLLVWQNDTVYFSIDKDLTASHSPAIMLGVPGNTTNEMKHLGGMLHLIYDKSQEGTKVFIETDTTQIISGLFYAVLGNDKPLMEPFWGGNTISVPMSAPTHDVYLPMPCGKYANIRISFLNEDEEELAAYEFSDIEIERATITTISLVSPPAKPSGKIVCKRAKIDRLELFQEGLWINGDSHEVITKDTTALSAHISYINATGILHNKIMSSHLHRYRSHIKFNLYRRPWHIKKRDNPTDSHWDYPAELELHAGENHFYPSAIVLRQCGKSQMSQFVRKNPEIVWLFIHTYTCDFDYKDFTRNDSLCGYVPEWKPKWGKSESYIDWKFVPDDGGKSISNRIKDPEAHRKDNHLRHPLNIPGTKRIYFWDAVTTDVENYLVVKHGVVKYQAVTVYRRKDGSVKGREATDKHKKFTTDIIGLEKVVKTKNNGEGTLTGYFKTDFVRSFGDSIKFFPSYFDGCERGFIILTEEEYQNAGNRLFGIKQHKHVSSSKQGEKFSCTVSKFEKDKKYVIWAYLQIDNYLFLSNPANYTYTNGQQENKENSDSICIFADIPALCDPYTNEIAPFVNDYLTKYCDVKKSHSAPKHGIMMTAYETVVAKYDELSKMLLKKSKLAATNGLNSNIPYQEESGLPYKIVSPIESIVITGKNMFDNNIIPFEEIEKNFKSSPLGLGIDDVTLFKQYPMIYCAIAQFKIQILSLDFPRVEILGRKQPYWQIFAYVPGNGPDGKHLGYTAYGFVYSVGKKPGDIVDVVITIVGWGPRNLVEQMKSLVFTKDYVYKDYMTGDHGNTQALKYYPKQPDIDWMDEWYNKLRNEMGLK